MRRPLAGIEVVDLSRILAGPFATQLLADLGATVRKLEPEGGDPTRQWGPPFAASGESAYFRCANRGKESEEIDLHAPEGQARLHALLERADVVVENFLPASAAALGLEPAALRARYPRLVVASIRSFAPDVEARDRAGYDFLLQAEAGWMAISGEADGRPSKVGIALVDVLAALYLANAIQAALLERERTGAGAHVMVPLMEAALAGLVNVGASALMTRAEPARYGNAHPSIVPYQTLRCADGELAVAAGSDRQFAALLAALGASGLLAANAGWATNPGRVADRDALIAALEQRTSRWTAAALRERLHAAGVPVGPVRGVADALIGERGRLHRAVASLRDPRSGEAMELVGTPILIDGERAVSDLPPPARSPREQV